MILERTFDRQLITDCVTHEHVWRMSADDTPLDRTFFFPPIPLNDSIIWLQAGDYGVFMGQKMNHVTFEVHTILLPSARGKAQQIAIKAMQWLFDNTGCLRITTSVPAYNKLAARLAIKAGMTQFGVNHKSFQKDGVLHDQLLFGINKGDLDMNTNKTESTRRLSFLL